MHAVEVKDEDIDYGLYPLLRVLLMPASAGLLCVCVGTMRC